MTPTEQRLVNRIDALERRLAEMEAILAEAKRALAAYDRIRIQREDYIISLITKEPTWTP